MTAYLKRSPHGYVINHKRVQRLMRKMGLQAIHPKPGTSKAAKGHKVYPYLQRHLAITRPNQVWSADITYIPNQSLSYQTPAEVHFVGPSCPIAA
jgi:putative transposase